MLRRRCAGLVLLLAIAGQAIAETDMRFPTGVTFIAETVDGKPLASTSQPTLTVDNAARLSGSTGCNRYSGAVQITGPHMKIGPVAMTRMACFGAAGENERLFAPAIATATAWQIQGKTLVLTTASGAIRLRRK